MMMPLVLLAVGAAGAGFIPFGHYVTADGTRLESEFHLQFSILPVALGLAGIVLAMWLYKNQSERPDKIATSLSGLYKAAYRKFYIDEIYLFITQKIIFNAAGARRGRRRGLARRERRPHRARGDRRGLGSRGGVGARHGRRRRRPHGRAPARA